MDSGSELTHFGDAPKLRGRCRLPRGEELRLGRRGEADGKPRGQGEHGDQDREVKS